MKKVNPFITSGYVSKKYFCDRKKELASLLSYIRNGVNTTLVSPRRMGKTGLIHRAFEDCKDFGCVYVDIMATRSIEDFNRVLSEAIFSKFSDMPASKRLTNRRLPTINCANCLQRRNGTI